MNLTAPILVWTDLETTGFNLTRHLDPATGVTLLGCQHHDIMEAACIITDLSLEPVAEMCIAISAEDIDFSKMDDWCTKTHTESGLVERCKQSTIRLHEAEEQVIAFLKEHGVEPKKGYLSGNSVHFDLTFLAAHMPDLTDYLHYRIVDVTGFKTTLTAKKPSLNEELDKIKTSRHEALADIRESLDEFKLYMNHFSL